ncbi:MAG: Crp/Fnr family transcriptional regulator, partial [Sulfurifustis sp.]
MPPIRPRPAPRRFVPTNQLLAALPKTDRERLLKHCRRYRLDFAQVLCEPGARVRHVYFPNRGLISFLTPVQGGAGVEVGMVGREGFAGIPLFLGVRTSPVKWLVQGTGEALRIQANDFAKELARSRPLRETLSRYLHTYIAQVAQTAACNSHHELG